MRIEELTFLRFVAAAVVVIFHYGGDASGFSGVLTSGPEMVTFFFVLSGFVMGIAYYKKDTPLNKYLWARVSRIAPVYFLALSMVVASYLIQNRDINPVSLALNITFLQSWLSPHPTSLNTPGWSLSVEAFFYISFPFILYHVKKYSLASAHIGMFAFLLWILTHSITTIVLNNYYTGYPSLLHDMVFYFPLTHLCSFLFGLSGAIWTFENKGKARNEVFNFVSLAVVISLIVLILNNKDSIAHFFELKKLAFGSSLLSPVFLALILFVSLARSSYIKLLSLYPLVVLGEASYSLYILQSPMHSIYNKYLSSMLSLNETMDFYVFFVFLLFVSILTFFLFEKPVNKFLRYSLPAILNSQLTKASSGRAKSARR